MLRLKSMLRKPMSPGTPDRSLGQERTHQHHYMLGMRLDYLSVEPFVSMFVDRAGSGSSAYCCVPDVHQCMLCHDDENHRAIVNGADYVMSDSTILQTARALRHGVPRIKTELGTRLMLALCAEAKDKGVPIALVGGRNTGALNILKQKLWEQFNGLQIDRTVNHHHVVYTLGARPHTR